jgi:hypothetical protein
MRRLVLMVGLCITLALHAADLNVAKTESSPPEDVSQTIRDVIGSGGLEVTAGDKVVAEFWLREDIPTKDAPSAPLGVSFGNLEEGVLMGVVRLAETWRDYKNLQVSPGIYTLRYAVEPQDGNHMGVSIYRDFMLLIPAAEDKEVDVSWTGDELYMKSYGATGQPHPGVLALFPVYDEISEPRIIMNDMDQPTLAVKLGSLTLGLVIEGHGEI